jgi:hypothetical protein
VAIADEQNHDRSDHGQDAGVHFAESQEVIEPDQYSGADGNLYDPDAEPYHFSDPGLPQEDNGPDYMVTHIDDDDNVITSRFGHIEPADSDDDRDIWDNLVAEAPHASEFYHDPDYYHDNISATRVVCVKPLDEDVLQSFAAKKAAAPRPPFVENYRAQRKPGDYGQPEHNPRFQRCIEINMKIGDLVARVLMDPGCTNCLMAPTYAKLSGLSPVELVR